MRGGRRRKERKGGKRWNCSIPRPGRENPASGVGLGKKRRGGLFGVSSPPAHCCLLPIWVLRQKVKQKKTIRTPKIAGRRVICAEDPTLPEQRWGVITLYMQEEEEETRKGEKECPPPARAAAAKKEKVFRGIPLLLLHSLPKEPKAQDRWPKLESLRHPSEEGGKWALNKLCTRLGCWPDFLLG